MKIFHVVVSKNNHYSNKKPDCLKVDRESALSVGQIYTAFWMKILRILLFPYQDYYIYIFDSLSKPVYASVNSTLLFSDMKVHIESLI